MPPASPPTETASWTRPSPDSPRTGASGSATAERWPHRSASRTRRASWPGPASWAPPTRPRSPCWADALWSAGDRPGAARAFADAIEVAPADASLRRERGSARALARRRSGRAVRDLSEAARLSPGDAAHAARPRPRFRGRREERRGRTGVSARRSRWIRNLGSPRYALGTLLVRTGRRDEGQRELEAYRTLYERALRLSEEQNARSAELGLAWAELNRGTAAAAWRGSPRCRSPRTASWAGPRLSPASSGMPRRSACSSAPGSSRPTTFASGPLLALEKSREAPRDRRGAPRPRCESAGSDCAVRFTDVAPAARLTFTHDRGATPEHRLPESMGAGLAWLDYDGDGWMDLYAVQSGPFPPGPGPAPAAQDRLYRNRGDGTFEDVTRRPACRTRPTAWARSRPTTTTTATWTSTSPTGEETSSTATRATAPSRTSRRRPAWRRRHGARPPPGETSTATAGSTSSSPGTSTTRGKRTSSAATGHGPSATYCPPIVYPGTVNVLFRNRGRRHVRGRHARVRTRTGPSARALGAVFLDLDPDGKPDLYVANDLVVNFLFRNLGGRFEDISVVSGAGFDPRGNPQGGMGVDAGDLDGDGLPGPRRRQLRKRDQRALSQPGLRSLRGRLGLVRLRRCAPGAWSASASTSSTSRTTGTSTPSSPTATSSRSPGARAAPTRRSPS